MALNTVTVNINQLAMPNGQVYNIGQVATLSDDQFALLSPLLFQGGSPALTLGIEDDSETSGSNSETNG